MNTQTYKDIKTYIKNIIKNTEFENNVFAVGGCCRDIMLGKNIKDMDLVVSLENGGIRFAEWLEQNNYTKGTVVTYPRFGTAMFRLKEFPEEDLEVVQTRTEVYTENSRKPDTAYGSLKDDCMRRDLTINAIYDDISNDKMLDVCGLSFDDINNCVIRTPCNPDQTYTDDPLRILRCVRFANRYMWNISKETYISMIRNVDRLSIISYERINDEFCKIIKDSPLGFVYLKAINAVKYILPGLNMNTKFFNAVANIKKTESLLTKLSIIGYFDPDMEVDMKRLKFSTEDIKHVTNIIKLVHEYTKIRTDKDNRRFCYNCNTFETYKEVMFVVKSVGMLTVEIPVCAKMFGYKLPINGDDIMNILNIEPCKKVRTILEDLMVQVFNNPNMSKDELIEFVKKNY